jgi:hypothetical protein
MESALEGSGAAVSVGEGAALLVFKAAAEDGSVGVYGLAY